MTTSETPRTFLILSKVFGLPVSISFWAFKKTEQKDRNIFHKGRDKAPFSPENVALKQEAKGHW
jgi:hypothetical protein